MINVNLSDGKILTFEKELTALELAEKISISLKKKSIAVMINDKIFDIRTTINKDCKIQILTTDHHESLKILRHSCAHLLAHAIKNLYQAEVQVTIGPVIENGFYYDFATENINFSQEDFPKIEAEMLKIAQRNLDIIRYNLSRNKAIEYFKSIGENYKTEIISKISNDEEISIYSQENFSDLCRGPHILNTKFLQHFKLTKVSGAYWRGDSTNKMLQRIYGTCFFTKQELEVYLFQVEEAKKRDHRILGAQLELFKQFEYAPGDIFWLENGVILYNIVQDYIRLMIKNDYQEVKTPQLLNKSLWEKSGHWEKYKENMFTSQIAEENSDFALKPMNCPCHILLFNSEVRSYKDLPIRISEFGKCHRYEPSGALHGLMRIRSFVQDDAHIFCHQEQIQEEIIKFCNTLFEVYKKFGFERDKISIAFETRPEKRAGSDEIWDLAENSLQCALNSLNVSYKICKGDGAFYGPKIAFNLKDALGREFGCGTIQVDFILPEKLEAKYINENGKEIVPVILHRAMIGSFERFIAFLIEHYAGALPFWLSPIQIAIIGINNTFDDYIYKIKNQLTTECFRVKEDLSANTISYKLRNLSLKKIPHIIIIGEKEIKNNSLSVRSFGSKETLIFHDISEYIKTLKEINA